MIAGAAVADGRERPLAAAASRTGIAYRALYVALAVAIAIGCVLAPPDSAGYVLGRFTGLGILHDRTLPLYLGTESFTADGSYAGAIGWLGALGIALLSNVAPAVALFATALAALATFAFVEMRARRAAGRGLALAAVALAGVCAVGSFGVAGGIVTAAFASALAYVLDRPGPRAAALATLLAVVWCNTAPQGLLAPAIALCMGLSAWYGGATPVQRRYALVALVGTALATLATPALLAYPVLAFEAMRVDRELAGVVASVNPVEVVPFAYRVGFTLAVFAAFAFGTQRGREGAIPLLLFGALLALANGAYVVVFGVLAAPVLAGSAAAAFPRLARPVPGSARGDVAALACAIAVALLGALQAGTHFTPLTGGYALAGSLAADRTSHRVYCTNVDWCDAALGAPNVRVFMDGRVAAYPDTVRARKRDVGNLKPGWRKQLADDGVDAIVAAQDRAFSGLVALSPGWRATANDDGTILYERVAGAR